MKSHLPSSQPTWVRWQSLTTAVILAALCLITFITFLQASPTQANGPYPIVTVILQQGDTPPIGGGLPVAFLNAPVTNGLGKVSFSGGLENGSDDTEFIWYDTALTWLSNGLISDVVSIEDVIGISNNGNYAMSLVLDPNGVDSLWTDDGLLLARGDAAPGIPGYYIVSVSRPTMQSNGLVNWFATLSNTPGGAAQLDVIYHATDVSTPIINPLLQGGDVVGSATIADNGLNSNYFLSDNGSHLITFVETTELITQNSYIYLDGALLLREDDPTGEGDNWDNFDFFQVNNSGDYVVSGDTDGNAATDEFIAYNGVIQVREGDTIGGVALSSSANVRQLSLNDAGQAAYTWSVLGGREILFYACDVADLAAATAVLGTNDLVDTDGNGTADATITDFNTSNATQGFALAEDGQIYVEVDLDYGAGSLEAVIAYTLPSCSGNMPPVAVNDSYTTTQATPLTIPAPAILGNDTDPEGAAADAVFGRSTGIQAAAAARGAGIALVAARR